MAYDENFQLKKAKDGTKDQKEVSRKNFLEACEVQTGEDEKKYEALWRHLGLSFDWEQQYETINDHSRKISQASFLDLKDKGYVYSSKSPTMWDTTFQTAVAQAEVEERDKSGHYHDITFKTETNESFVISTTRPELLAACIAVVAHPDDEVLGCGGTIAKHKENGDELYWLIVTNIFENQGFSTERIDSRQI